MIAADLRLKEKPDDADYVVEARVGTLGSDGNEIVYGIPANKGLAAASVVLPNAPSLPVIPEISVARKESQLGAVKVAAFAYDRKSGSAVWQSGIARARSTSQDVWLFGAGPFQRGSIHTGTEFAGGELRLPGRPQPEELVQSPPVAFSKEFYFSRWPAKADRPASGEGRVAPASAVVPVPPPRELQTLDPTSKPVTSADAPQLPEGTPSQPSFPFLR